MAKQPKLPYDLSSLHWTRHNFFTKKFSRNDQKKYCYCGENKQDLEDHCVQCAECDNWFHVSCTEAVPKTHDKFLPFQLNYHFVCKCCNYPTWQESFKLIKSSWVQTVISAQSHLMWSEQRACYKVAEVGRFIEEKWSLLCLDADKDGNLIEKDKKNGKWKGPLNSYWTTHQKKFFTQPQRGYWGLQESHAHDNGPCLQPLRVFRGPRKDPPPEEKKEPKPRRPKIIPPSYNDPLEMPRWPGLIMGKAIEDDVMGQAVEPQVDRPVKCR